MKAVDFFSYILINDRIGWRKDTIIRNAKRFFIQEECFPLDIAAHIASGIFLIKRKTNTRNNFFKACRDNITIVFFKTIHREA